MSAHLKCNYLYLLSSISFLLPRLRKCGDFSNIHSPPTTPFTQHVTLITHFNGDNEKACAAGHMCSIYGTCAWWEDRKCNHTCSKKQINKNKTSGTGTYRQTWDQVMNETSAREASLMRLPLKKQTEQNVFAWRSKNIIVDMISRLIQQWLHFQLHLVEIITPFSPMRIKHSSELLY